MPTPEDKQARRDRGESHPSSDESCPDPSTGLARSLSLLEDSHEDDRPSDTRPCRERVHDETFCRLFCPHRGTGCDKPAGENFPPISDVILGVRWPDYKLLAKYYSIPQVCEYFDKDTHICQLDGDEVNGIKATAICIDPNPDCVERRIANDKKKQGGSPA